MSSQALPHTPSNRQGVTSEVQVDLRALCFVYHDPLLGDVMPERVPLPTRAGSVDPQRWAGPAVAAAMEDLSLPVLPPVEGSCLCHLAVTCPAPQTKQVQLEGRLKQVLLPA